jgi:hypothetical protein
VCVCVWRSERGEGWWNERGEGWLSEGVKEGRKNVMFGEFNLMMKWKEGRKEGGKSTISSRASQAQQTRNHP